MGSQSKSKGRGRQLQESGLEQSSGGATVAAPQREHPADDTTELTDYLAGFESWASLKILRGDTERRRLLVEFIAQPERKSPDLPDAALRLLLDNYAPPSVVVDGRFRCRCYFGPVEEYLDKAGEVKGDLFAVAHAKLVPKLKAALTPFCAEGAGAALAAGVKHEEESFALPNIAVLPFENAGETLFLVSFRDAPACLEAASNGKHSRGNHGALAYQQKAAEPMASLSPRQRAVLQLVASGESNKRIAFQLGISQRTVESHRAIVMRKLGARSLAGLMRLVTAV